MFSSFFKKENHHFLVYVHCLYINKWHNSMYIFNNLIIIFHFFTSNEFTLCSIDSKVVLVCP